jgi:hypothetical protein
VTNAEQFAISLKRWSPVMTDETMKLFLRISLHRMYDQYLPKLRQCIGAIDTLQLWERAGNQANSIGGIILHICEQIRRNTTRYQEPGTVFAKGTEDYFPDAGLSREDLLREVEDAFSSWRRVMERLLADTSPTVDMHSMYHLVEHTSYHLGQVVDRVQTKTGIQFKFVQNGMNERNLRALIEQTEVICVVATGIQ